MRLFVYGTLLDGLARGEAARLIGNLPPGVPASLAGELRLIKGPHGCYPALVPACAGRVTGKVIECPDDPRWLAELDAYEGEDFSRRTMIAELKDGGRIEVQAYVWLGAGAKDLPLVTDGDFARFIAATGRRVHGA